MSLKDADKLLEDFDHHRDKDVISLDGNHSDKVRFCFVRNNKLMYRLHSGLDVKVADYKLQ